MRLAGLRRLGHGRRGLYAQGGRRPLGSCPRARPVEADGEDTPTQRGRQRGEKRRGGAGVRNHFQYSSQRPCFRLALDNTLVRSSQRPCMGRYCGAPTAAGWGEDCWTRPPISPPPGSALSHRSDTQTESDVITHMHTSMLRHFPPTGTEKGTDCLAELNRCGSRHKTHFDHLIIHHSNNQLLLQHVLICLATAEFECGH